MECAPVVPPVAAWLRRAGCCMRRRWCTAARVSWAAAATTGTPPARSWRTAAQQRELGRSITVSEHKPAYTGEPQSAGWVWSYLVSSLCWAALHCGGGGGLGLTDGPCFLYCCRCAAASASSGPCRAAGVRPRPRGLPPLPLGHVCFRATNKRLRAKEPPGSSCARNDVRGPASRDYEEG